MLGDSVLKFCTGLYQYAVLGFFSMSERAELFCTANRKYMSAKNMATTPTVPEILTMVKGFTFGRRTACSGIKHSNFVMILFIGFDDFLLSLFAITPKLVTDVSEFTRYSISSVVFTGSLD